MTYTTVEMSRFDQFDRIFTGARHIVAFDSYKTLCGVRIDGNTDNSYLDIISAADCKRCRNILKKRKEKSSNGDGK